jgi:hypothetical protein
MAWINIEVIGSGDNPEDIHSVQICRDDDGEKLLFKTSEEADLWCQENAEMGALYWHIEVWG